MQAIIWKELRQHRVLAVAGTLAIGVFAYIAAPRGLNDFFNVAFYSSAVPTIGWGAAAWALVLGFAQSFWDYGDRQGDYLRHRAVSDQDIWIGKVIAGAILFAAALAVPLLVLTAYLARVGPLELPTRPIQVVPVVQLAALCFFLQPAMMLSIRRPAAWLGSRFFPVVPVAFLCMLYAFLAGNTASAWGIWIVCLTTLIAIVWLGRKPGVVNAALIAGAVGVVGILAIAALTLAPSGASPQQPFMYGVDESNRAWAVQLNYQRTDQPGDPRQRYQTAMLLRDDSAESPTALPPGGPELNLAQWWSEPQTNDGHDRGRVEHYGYANRGVLLYDHAGYLSYYGDNLSRQLAAYVGRDGFYRRQPPPQARFPQKPINLGRGQFETASLLSDRDGIYHVDLEARTVRKLLDGPIEKVFTVDFAGQETPQYVIRRGGRWTRYQFVADEEEGQPNAPENSPASSGVQPALQAVELGDLPPPPLDDADARTASMAGTPDGHLTIFMPPVEGERTLLSYDPAEGVWQTRRVEDPTSPTTQNHLDLAAATLFPPAITAGGLAIGGLNAWWHNGQLPPTSPSERREIGFFAVGSAVVVILSCLAVSVLAGRYRLTRRQTLRWLLSTLPLGIAAPLSMAAIYSRPVLEDCPSCRRPRRVDHECCEHCGAAWPEPEREGVELFEDDQLRRSATRPREEYATTGN